MTEAQNFHELDVSDHKCPIPVLRLRRLLEKLQSGERINVIATDPMTLIDIPNFCRETGHVIERQQEKDETFLYIVKKC
jgi:tRNA 2-thiouridine synthesizing protein A